MIKELVAGLKEYWTLITMISTAVGAVFFVRDYFATKEEVEILKCQAQNGIAIVESRMNIDQLTKRIIAIKAEVEDTTAKLKIKVREPEKTGGIVSLTLEEDKLRTDLKREHERLQLSADNLKDGACAAAVRKSCSSQPMAPGWDIRFRWPSWSARAPCLRERLPACRSMPRGATLRWTSGAFPSPLAPEHAPWPGTTCRSNAPR